MLDMAFLDMAFLDMAFLDMAFLDMACQFANQDHLTSPESSL